MERDRLAADTQVDDYRRKTSEPGLSETQSPLLPTDPENVIDLEMVSLTERNWQQF